MKKISLIWLTYWLTAASVRYDAACSISASTFKYIGILTTDYYTLFHKSGTRERREKKTECVHMAFGHFRPLYEAMKPSDKRIHYLWQARTNRNELLFLTRKAGPIAKSQHFEFISKNVIDSIEIE